jgi:DNA-binding SARP family transcriptional activator
MGTKVRIELLGGLAVMVNGQRAPRFRSQKPPALLAYLARYPGMHHGREQLIAILWPEADRDAGRNRLNVTLSRIRAHLAAVSEQAADIIRSDRFHVWLDAESVEIDVTDLERHLQLATGEDRLRRLIAAVDLYRGPLLPGNYDEWVGLEQERLGHVMRECCAEVVRLLEQEGRPEDALRYARKAVALDPLQEASQRDLIRLLARQGMTADALQQYRNFENLLREELGAEPDEQTRSLCSELFPRRNGDSRQTELGLRRDATDQASWSPENAGAPLRLAEADSRVGATLTQSRGASKVRLMLVVLLVAAVAVLSWTSIWSSHKTSMQTPPSSVTSDGRPLGMFIYSPAADERDSEPTAIATDRFGYTYVTGFVQTVSHDVDFLTLKFDPRGRLAWRRRYNGKANDCDRARSIAVDLAGNVYVSGDCYGGESRNGGTEWDIVTVKYAPDGSFRWAARLAVQGRRDEHPAGMGMDGAGNIYVAGTASLGGKGSTYILAKLDAAGTTMWTVRHRPVGMDLDVAELSTLAFTVEKDGTATLTGEGTVIDAAGKRTLDLITSRHDRQGNLLWQRRFTPEGPGALQGRVVTVDAAHYVYVAARHSGASVNPVSGTVSEAMQVVKYDAEGRESWSASFLPEEGHPLVVPTAIDVDASSVVYVAARAMSEDHRLMSYAVAIDAAGGLLWKHHLEDTEGHAARAGGQGVYLSGERAASPSPLEPPSRIDTYYLSRQDGKTIWQQEVSRFPRVKQSLLHRGGHGEIVTAAQIWEGHIPAIALFWYTG